MARRPSVSIVGCGRTGGSIALALQRAGYVIPAVWSRSRAGRMRAARLLDAPVLADAAETVGAAEVAVIAVPDDAIAGVAAQVAANVRPRQRVVHTSGSVSVEALDPVRQAGGRIGSLHPLQTLSDPESGAEALEGAGVAVTCDDADRRFFHRLVGAWGGQPFALPDEAKALYHAAAVFASNYVVAALWAATQLFDEIEIRHARGLLGSLAAAAVDNVVQQGAEAAITGPVSRGDVETVRRHVAALREADRLQIIEAYRAFAILTAHVSGRDPAPVAEAVG